MKNIAHDTTDQSALVPSALCLGVGGTAARRPEPAGFAEPATAVLPGCRGAARTGARRTGRSFRAELHCGLAPGVHRAAWPGAENEAEKLAACGCAGSATFGLAAGSVIDPISSSPVSSELPCETVPDRVTAEPANSAPKVRAVGLQGMGDAGE
jgi:hypothetical protein